MEKTLRYLFDVKDFFKDFKKFKIFLFDEKKEIYHIVNYIGEYGFEYIIYSKREKKILGKQSELYVNYFDETTTKRLGRNNDKIRDDVKL